MQTLSESRLSVTPGGMHALIWPLNLGPRKPVWQRFKRTITMSTTCSLLCSVRAIPIPGHAEARSISRHSGMLANIAREHWRDRGERSFTAVQDDMGKGGPDRTIDVASRTELLAKVLVNDTVE